METTPSISTDQVAALVELARQGSLRAAAEQLHITEQGVRNRLLALERRLGVPLYRKSRGMRRMTPLTPEGKRFLPHAIEFLHRAGELCELFDESGRRREVNVVASQYLIAYVLIDAVRQFHAAYPDIRVRLTSRIERDIEQVLLEDVHVSLGVAAPYAPSPELAYSHLFSMDWSVITPPRHRLLRHEQVTLAQLAEHPLILYESGSTGRQHLVDAFLRRGIAPAVEMETTNTDLIVRMVEAGLGVSIVPLLPSGAVTRGRRVGVRPLADEVRPIDSGVLTRSGERLSTAARTFVEFVQGSMK
jgi:DNA-binding transcriptional LysR family regulator